MIVDSCGSMVLLTVLTSAENFIVFHVPYAICTFQRNTCPECYIEQGHNSHIYNPVCEPIVRAWKKNSKKSN